MARKRDAYKLGLVIILMVAAAIGVMIFIPSLLPHSDTVAIRVRFPHYYALPTLEEGSAVLVGGQKAGAIKTVALEENRPTSVVVAASQAAQLELFVVVTMLVDRNIHLHSNCRVIPEGPPLGGPGLLRIEVGDSQQMLAEGDTIDGSPPAGFAAVLETLNKTVGAELNGNDPSSLLGMVKTQLDATQTASLVAKLHRSMDDFNAMTTSVRTQLDPSQRDVLMSRLNSIMDNMNATTAALRQQVDATQPNALIGRTLAALDTLNRALTSVRGTIEESRPPLKSTLQHVAHTAETLDTRVMENIAAQTDMHNAASLLSKVHEAADHLNETLKNITTVSGTARDVMVLNRENINEMLRNFKQTSEHLKSAIKFVLQRPWLLFNPPAPGQTRQQDIFDATRSFAEAAAHMDDATSDLKALSELHHGQIPAYDPDLLRIRAEMQNTFDKLRQAEASLWKELDVK